MVLKGPSVLSCLLPARFAFGSNQRAEPSAHTRDEEKLAKDNHTTRLGSHNRLAESESALFRGNPLPNVRTDSPDPSRARANTTSNSLPSRLFIPNGDVGHSPSPAPRSLAPPVRPKRSSFTTFFAFSSKRRLSQGPPIHQRDLLVPPQSVSVPDSSRTEAHLVNPSSIPSPLLTDEEEYYYSYYTSLTPTFPSHPASPHPDSVNVSPAKRLSVRQQDLVGNPDLDSQHSSPVTSRSPHTQMQHPYAYSTPLYSKPSSKIIVTAPSLRHATSQPLQPHSQAFHPDIGAGIQASQLGHEPSKGQSHLKTSMSTPNLASGAASVRPRSLIRKRPPTRSKGQERWLSAETWWDALFSPSPRFKVKQAPRPHTASGKIVRDVRTPVGVESNKTLGTTTVSSLPYARPRAASISSVASNIRPTLPGLTRSRSAADLINQPSTSAIPRAAFEPALETLVDVPTPVPDQAPGSDAEVPTSVPFLSLEQVIDEGEAFEQQRAEWKRQASRSLGNKHTRSFSRARSKSLGEKLTRPHTAESHKSQFNLEFLAARTLLGSQSTMPTVHVTKPGNSISHSKAYSHSHSHSAYSFSRTSHSHAHSHSHSHSLTTSNSSKSSRNCPHRGHSRNGSWSRTAFLKAGALCGIVQDESYSAEEDEQVPLSSRVDAQDTAHIGTTNNESIQDAVKASPTPPIGEVGLAVTSSTPSEARFDFSIPGHPYVSAPQHEEADQENRWSSKYTTKSSDYAGPHPSAIDSNLPQLGAASNVSLRHRLPPRPAIHPPIAPIAHPYRSPSGKLEQAGSMRSEGTTSKVNEGHVVTEPDTKRVGYPHLSLSHADFAQYGVGEALVYASLPRPVLEAKQTNIESNSTPESQSPPPEAQSPSPQTVAQPTEELDTSSLGMNSTPSVTNSTIQMVMSAFDNPDDLDEFQDLFYRPSDKDPSVAISQMPPEVHGSEASSPLSHLVRKLSEEVQSLRGPSRTPSESMRLQRNESHDYPPSESGTKFVFSDLVRSSSPPPMESPSMTHLPNPKGSESAAQPAMIISEDFNSSYTTSALDTSLGDPENDTFGYPIKRGQFEAAIAPSPIQSPNRLSTHLSIQEDVAEDDAAFLSPVTKRYGLPSPTDVVRSSYMTTSDASRMSELSDFPLPPNVIPGGQFGRMSTLETYFETTSPSSSPESQNHGRREDESESEQTDSYTEVRIDGGPAVDVLEALRALRATPRVTSYQSDRTTFGGSDDTDQLYQAGA